jgi:hypothetical protein
MNERTIIDGETGEIIDHKMLPALQQDAGALSTMSAEIGQQIATARRFPRERDVVLQGQMEERATLDEDTANECMYSLPRAGTPIEGPSSRYAEIVQQVWGNNRASGAVMYVDREQMRVYAEGVYLDLQTNSATRVVVWRRVSSKNRKTGKEELWSEDMIQIAGSAATSIAKRNAILQGVPKPVWRKGYESVRKVVMGTTKTLSQRRNAAMVEFQRFGLTAAQVLGLLGCKAIEDVTLDHLVPLRGMLAALKSGEATVEEILSRGSSAGVPSAPPAGETVRAEQSEKPAEKPKVTQTESQANKATPADEWTQDKADAHWATFKSQIAGAVAAKSLQAVDAAVGAVNELQGVPRTVMAAFQAHAEEALDTIRKLRAEHAAAKKATAEADEAAERKAAAAGTQGTPEPNKGPAPFRVGQGVFESLDPDKTSMEVAAIAGDDVTCNWRLANGKAVTATFRASELTALAPAQPAATATAKPTDGQGGGAQPKKVADIAKLLREARTKADLAVVIAAELTPFRAMLSAEEINELDFICGRREKLLQE